MRKRNIMLPDNTNKIIFQCNFFGKTIISEHLQKILYFHVFSWERLSFIFRLLLGKRNVIFPGNTKKTIFQCDFFWKTIFSKHLQKISYFHGFYQKMWFFIFRLKNKIIFSKKIMSSFLIIQERSYSSAMFWEDHHFRTFIKRKYDFSCSAKLKTKAKNLLKL